MKKFSYKLVVTAILAIVLAPSAYGLAPVVDRIGFYAHTEGGAGGVELHGLASCDGGISVVGIDFSVVGVSAEVLMEEYGGSTLPLTAEALDEAAAAVLLAGEEFVDATISGIATGVDGEYRVLVEVAGGVPVDAIFVVGAVAEDGNGEMSAEKKVLLVLEGEEPSGGEVSLSVINSGDVMHLLMSASFADSSDLAGVSFTVRGYSADGVMDADAILESSADFVTDTLFVEASFSGQTAFSGVSMVGEGTEVPMDGVLVVEAEAVDLSGNRSMATGIFYAVDEESTPEVESLEVIPGSTILTGFGDVVQLTVYGQISGGGKIDITGSETGISYVSSVPGVATISADGLVTGLAEGSTTVTINYQGHEVTATIEVAEAAALLGIELGPEGLVLDRVGAPAQLEVTGSFSNGESYNITQARFGTEYVYSHAMMVNVDEDGLLTSSGVGTVTVTAANGQYSDSMEVEVLDGPPTISLSSSSMNVPEDDTFQITATVDDDLGLRGIDEVRFFIDGDPLFTDEHYPYVLSLQPPSGRAGTTMTVTARVLDYGGNLVISDALVISIQGPSDTVAPDLDMEFPSVATRAIVGIVMPLQVTTGVGGEALKSVEFYVDGAKVGQSSFPRYEQRETGPLNPSTGKKEMETWTVWKTSYVPPANAAGRSLAVYSRGFDDNGNETVTDTVIIRIVEDQPPEITVTSPVAGGEVIANRDLTVRFSVHDDLDIYGETVRAHISTDLATIDDNLVYSGSSGGGAVAVDYLSDFQTSGSSNFSFTYAVPSGSGKNYYLKIEATDYAENTSTCDIVTFTSKANMPPSVYISWPLAGTELTVGDTTAVRAVASDDGGVSTVEIFRDSQPGVPGGEKSLGLFSIGPYESIMEVPSESMGSTVAVYAEAVDDLGMKTVSSQVLLPVLADDTPPTVSITEPLDGAEISEARNILIGVGGFDDIRVSRVEVEVKVNGSILRTYEKDNPGIVDEGLNTFYTNFLLPLADTAAGDLVTLQARAEDPNGNETSSSLSRITITGDEPPTVAITSPTSGSQLIRGKSYDVFALVTDDNGIDRAELFVNGALSGTDDVAPFQFSYSVPAASGEEALTMVVKATDSAAQFTTDTVSVTAVPDTTSPLVSIQDPAAGSDVRAAEEITIVAGARDDVLVDRVEFYVDGSPVGTDSSGESSGGIFQIYSVSYTFQSDLIGEAVTLRAVVTDWAENTGEKEIEVNVVGDSAPEVSIIDPVPNAAYYEGMIIDLTGVVADDLGVVRLDAYSGGELVDTLLGSPTIDTGGELNFAVTVPVVDAPEDPRTLGLKATDTGGNETFEEIELTVLEDDQPPLVTVTAPHGWEEYYPGDVFRMSAETEDDVRVVSVEFRINGEVVATTTEGLNEEEHIVTVDNPISYGEVIVSRTVTADFEAEFTVPTDILGEADSLELVITVVAVDPAGNDRTSQAVTVEVIEDDQPPAVRIVEPSEGGKIVEETGYTVTANITDNIGVETVYFTVDGVTVPGVPISMNRAVVQFEAKAVTEDEEIVVEVKARDGAGNEGIATVTAVIIPDQGPTLTITAPEDGAAVTEGKSYGVTVSTEDDVGVAAVNLFRSSGAVTAVSGPENLIWHTFGGWSEETETIGSVGLELISGESSTELHYDLTGEFDEQSGASTRLYVSPDGLLVGEGDNGVLVVTGADGAGLAEVGYDLYFGTGDFDRQTGVLSSEPYTYYFTIPAGAEEIMVEVKGLDGAGEDLPDQLERIGITGVSGGGPCPVRVDLVTGDGEQYISANTLVIPAGQNPSPSRNFSLPDIYVEPGTAPAVQSIAALGVDTAGSPAAASPTEVSFVTDQAVPAVTIDNYDSGDNVVEGRGITVVVKASDDVKLKKVYLFLDGSPLSAKLTSSAVATLNFEVSIPAGTAGNTVEFSARAEDEAGNIGFSAKVELNVIEDDPPEVTIASVSNSLIPGGHLQNPADSLPMGGISVLEGTVVMIQADASDFVGLSRVEIFVDDESMGAATLSGHTTFSYQTGFMVPRGTNGWPYEVRVEAEDILGQMAESEVIIRSQSDEAPQIAIAAPINEQDIAEGTFAVTMKAVAADNIAIGSVTFLIDGAEAGTVPRGAATGIELATELSGADLVPIRDELGRVIPFDPQVAEAVYSFPSPYDNCDPEAHADPDTVPRVYSYKIDIPIGLLDGRTQVTLGALASDSEGNTTLKEIVLNIIADESSPLVSVVAPELDFDAVEDTELTITATAGDNTHVKRVEILIGVDGDTAPPEYVPDGYEAYITVDGPTGGKVIYSGEDFPLSDYIPGSTNLVDIEPVSILYSLPKLSEIGLTGADRVPFNAFSGGTKVPYIIIVRAWDHSGLVGTSWTEIDLIPDNNPIIDIVTPIYGTEVVEGASVARSEEHTSELQSH